MRIAIRDDDTSNWTGVEDIQKIYGDLLDKNIRISLAVVPESYKFFSPGDRQKFYLSDEKVAIDKNTALVEYLQPYVKKGILEIMMHGYDHSYCVQTGKDINFLNSSVRDKIGAKVPDVLLPECIYKSDGRLAKEFSIGKQILEDTFHTKIKTFVPPSNALRASAVREIEKLGMNISGTMTKTFNRDKDIYAFHVMLKKVIWKLRRKNISYPYLMKYRNHNELTGHSLTPSTDFDSFFHEYKSCMELNCDFVLATHYWQLLEEKGLYSKFKEFIQMAEKTGRVVCLWNLLS